MPFRRIDGQQPCRAVAPHGGPRPLDIEAARTMQVAHFADAPRFDAEPHFYH